MPERQYALAALARNGFACSAAADQAPSVALLREAMRSAAAAPSGDPNPNPNPNPSPNPNPNANPSRNPKPNRNPNPIPKPNPNQAPSGDDADAEAEAAERLRSWPYYATALHSRFVASPAGHGRDG